MININGPLSPETIAQIKNKIQRELVAAEKRPTPEPDATITPTYEDAQRALSMLRLGLGQGAGDITRVSAAAALLELYWRHCR